MNELKRTLIHLSLAQGIGPATIARLTSSIELLEQIYDLDAHALQTIASLSEKNSSIIRDALSNKAMFERELNFIEQEQVTCISIYDPEYPALLKTIHLPPTILYVKGTLPTSPKTIGFVGARQANAYGKQATHQLATELVHNGWNTISGGAQGIDAYAHQATLEAGGTTCAVLGSSLMRPYPAQNRKLFDAIVASGGSVISPFTMHTETLPGNFPARNRIISGLSQGVIVVQAAKKSGALITADYALHQGRDLYAIPGSIFDPLSEGCHNLIAQGAIPLYASSQITGIGKEAAAKISTASHDERQLQTSVHAVAHKKSETIEEKIVTSCAQPTSFDDLLDLTGLAMHELHNTLFDLQLNQQIYQTASGLWAR